MKDTLDILVIEDSPESIAAARNVLAPWNYVLAPGDVINSDYAGDLSEAMQLIGSKKYDGVLLDLCFPEKTGSGLKEKARELLQEFEDDETLAYLHEEIYGDNESLQPLGFLVAKHLKQQRTEFVFVSTVGFGHGMKTNPFYSLRRYAKKIGAEREFEWTIMDLEDPHYRNVGVNELIAKDTYQSLQEKGANFNEIRKRLTEITANHHTYKGWSFEKDKFDDKTVAYWAIKLGLVPPVKGQRAYEGAFSALHLPFHPGKRRALPI